MSENKIGFIGCGNMASAIIKGLISKAGIAPENIFVSDVLPAATKKAADAFGVSVSDNLGIASDCDVLFLSVKPQFYESVISEIKDTVKDTQLIITIAPGKTLSWLNEKFGKELKIVRTMPNTPAFVGEGITGVCRNSNVLDSDYIIALKLLGSFGIAEDVPEHLMDAVCSVSGSSPAYVFMFIEAMADSAVMDGMPRDKAYRFAAQAVLGSAKMVLESGKHPGELKDMVCSPGGTTIEGVKTLEEKGFRGTVISAMQACTKKAKGM